MIKCCQICFKLIKYHQVSSNMHICSKLGNEAAAKKWFHAARNNQKQPKFVIPTSLTAWPMPSTWYSPTTSASWDQQMWSLSGQHSVLTITKPEGKQSRIFGRCWFLEDWDLVMAVMGFLLREEPERTRKHPRRYMNWLSLTVPAQTMLLSSEVHWLQSA